MTEVIVLVRQRQSNPDQNNPDGTRHFGKFARFDSLEGVNHYVDELRED